MGFFNIIKNFGKGKVASTGDDIVAALAKFDPEGMSEAGMLQLEEQVDTMAKEVADARLEYLQEQRQADKIQELFDQRMTAAESLQAKLEAGDTSVESSLVKLIELIEEMTPEVEREKQEAVEAKEILDELELGLKDVAEQMKNARNEFNAIQRGMKKAKAKQERAERNEERAKKLAGIRGGGTGLSSAMDAMKKAQQESEAAADAANMKAKLLQPTNVEEDDPTIAAALAAAKGETPTSELSLSDRLAALKK